MIVVARVMAAVCLLLVPVHAALFGGAGHPLIVLGFAALDVATAVSWRMAARRLVARRRHTAPAPLTGRTTS